MQFFINIGILEEMHSLHTDIFVVLLIEMDFCMQLLIEWTYR